MTPQILIKTCPLWDLDEYHTQLCLASDDWCSLENAEPFQMCPKYKLMIKLLGACEE